jgi:hypothetical protein
VSESGQSKPSIPIVFGAEEWREEVCRFGAKAVARVQAQSARRAIEGGSATMTWRRCQAEGPDATKLVHCLKLYVPLEEGVSKAPYGLVFELQRDADGDPMLNFVAFGERHPGNERTRTVYERAHKRLHGRYP